RVGQLHRLHLPGPYPPARRRKWPVEPHHDGHGAVARKAARGFVGSGPGRAPGSAGVGPSGVGFVRLTSGTGQSPTRLRTVLCLACRSSIGGKLCELTPDRKGVRGPFGGAPGANAPERGRSRTAVVARLRGLATRLDDLPLDVA